MLFPLVRKNRHTKGEKLQEDVTGLFRTVNSGL